MYYRTIVHERISHKCVGDFIAFACGHVWTVNHVLGGLSHLQQVVHSEWDTKLMPIKCEVVRNIAD